MKTEVQLSHIDLPSLIPEIVNDLVRRFNPRYVVLFGSVARGDFNEYSDMDLIVIKDDDDGKIFALSYIYTNNQGVKTDLWGTGETTYAASAHIPGSFCWYPALEGKVVYTRPGLESLDTVIDKVAWKDIMDRKEHDLDNYLELAKKDLRGARLLFADRDYNNAVFMAQRATEKSLKALLVKLGIAPNMTHNIVELTQALPEDLQSEFDMKALDHIYDPIKRLEDGKKINIQYIADIPELTESNVKAVIAQAEEVNNICVNTILHRPEIQPPDL